MSLEKFADLKKPRINNKYVVRYKNRGRMINEKLLNKMGAVSKLDQIKKIHYEILVVEDEMKNTDDELLLMMFDALYTQLEFELQEAWGFPQDINCHRFWWRPKCTCPKTDNDDNYPHGRYVINRGCVLHG